MMIIKNLKQQNMKLKNTILLLGVLLIFGSCQEKNVTTTPKIEPGMVKVTLLYANGAGKTFDMDYYASTHMPLVARLLGDPLIKYEIDKGVAGRTPEDSIPFLAIGYLYFDALEDYRAAFGPVAGEIVGDIPNFTNIQPVVQISEIIE